MHRPSDVDIDFLICFRQEIFIGEVQGPLHAGVVDHAVEVWVLGREAGDEGGDGGGAAGVEDVVGDVVAEFVRGGAELGFGAAGYDYFFVEGEEVLG